MQTKKLPKFNTSFGYTLERGDDEIDVEVLGYYTKGYAGDYYQPADDGDFDIVSVADANGNEIELTDDEEEAIVERGFEVALED